MGHWRFFPLLQTAQRRHPYLLTSTRNPSRNEAPEEDLPVGVLAADTGPRAHAPGKATSPPLPTAAREALLQSYFHGEVSGLMS